MSAPDSLKWIDSTLAKEYPLGVYKDITEKKEADSRTK